MAEVFWKLNAYVHEISQFKEIKAKNETVKASMNDLLFAFRIIHRINQVFCLFQCWKFSREYARAWWGAGTDFTVPVNLPTVSPVFYSVKLIHLTIINDEQMQWAMWGFLGIIIILPLTITTFVVSVHFSMDIVLYEDTSASFFKHIQFNFHLSLLFFQLKSNFNYFPSIHCVRVYMRVCGWMRIFMKRNTI